MYIEIGANMQLNAAGYSLDPTPVSVNKTDEVLTVDVVISRTFLGESTVKLTVIGGKESGEDYGLGKNYTGSVTEGTNTAWVNSDYETSYTTVSFGAEDETRTITLTIFNNPVIELDRVLIVYIPGWSKQITIVDDNAAVTIDVTNQAQLDSLSISATALDKTGATDISSDLQAIVDYLKDNSGGIAYLPNGTYRKDDEITLTGSTNPVSVIGESVDGVVIKKTYTAAPPAFHQMFKSSYAHITDDSAYLSVQNMSLEIAGVMGSYEHNDGIFITATDNSGVNAGRVKFAVGNVKTYNILSYSIGVYDNAEAKIDNVTFTNDYRGGITATGGYSTIDGYRIRGIDCSYDFELEIEHGEGYGGSKQLIATFRDYIGNGGSKLGLYSDVSVLTFYDSIFQQTSKSRTISGYGRNTHNFVNTDFYCVPDFGSTIRANTIAAPGVANFENCNIYIDYDGPNYSMTNRPVQATTSATSATVKGDGADTTLSGYLTSALPIVSGSLVVTGSDLVEIFTDNGDGTLTGNNEGSGTIDYTTGAIALTFGAALGNGYEIYGTYNYTQTTALLHGHKITTQQNMIILSAASTMTSTAPALPSGWTGENWVGTGTTAQHTAGAGNTQPLNFEVEALADVTYQLKFDLTITAGSITPGFGGGSGTLIEVGGGGTGLLQNILSTATSGGISFTPSADFEGTIDNVFVYTLGQVIDYKTCNFSATAEAEESGISCVGILETREYANLRSNKITVNTSSVFDDSLDFAMMQYEKGGWWVVEDSTINAETAFCFGCDTYIQCKIEADNLVFNGSYFYQQGRVITSISANAGTSLSVTNTDFTPSNSGIRAYTSPANNTNTGPKTITGTEAISATFRPHGLPGDQYTDGETTWVLADGEVCWYDLDLPGEVGEYTLWSTV